MSDKRKGYTKRWRKRWEKGYHRDSLLWVMMDYFIDHANYADGEVFVKGCGIIPLKRGQHIFGTSRMADFLGVARSLARRKLKILENINFLAIKTTNKYSIATVINYDTYQDPPQEGGQQIDQQIGQQPAIKQASRWATHKERKNIINNNPPLPPQKIGGANAGGFFSKIDFPPWLNKKLFLNYCEMRRQINKPITTKETIAGLLAQIRAIMDKGYAQDVIIQRAIDLCWLSFYEPIRPKTAGKKAPDANEKAYNFPKCPHCGDEATNIVKGQPCPWCKEIV